MAARRDHTIHRDHAHFGWDNALQPALTVAPGQSVELHTVDSSGGQLPPNASAADLAQAGLRSGQSGHRPGADRRRRAWRRGEGHALGLRAVRLGMDGEHPGFRPACRPVPRTRALQLDLRPGRADAGAVQSRRPGAAEAVLRHDRRLPRAQPGCHSVVPPRRVGGNMDIRDLAAGHRALLAGGGRGRAVLGRRYACGAGRRRGLRHGDRKPNGGRG